MSAMVRIELPWINSDLHPNARGHWAKKARAVKQARSVAAWTCTTIKGLEACKGKRIRVTPVLTPPRNRGDTDNMVAACKAYYDGIADVIGINDKHWTFGAPRREPAKSPGNVTIEIEVI